MTDYAERFNEIAAHLNRTDEAAGGSMFGAKCIKIGKKAFAMFRKDDMVFKLPPGHEAADLEGAGIFEPSPGKRMNGWLTVPNRHAGEWEALAEAALRYVRSLAE